MLLHMLVDIPSALSGLPAPPARLNRPVAAAGWAALGWPQKIWLQYSTDFGLHAGWERRNGALLHPCTKS